MDQDKVEIVQERKEETGKCENVFNTRKQTNESIKEMYSAHKQCQCMDCGKSFTRKSSLIVHQRIHTGEKLFMCSECGKRFGLKSSMVRHMRTHTPKTLKICPDCGKCFSHYSSLFQHQKVHRKERLYRHPHCEKSLRQVSQLLVHQKIHKRRPLPEGCEENVNNLDKLSIKKNIVCPECGKYFKEHRSLLRHQVIHKESSTPVSTNKDDGFAHNNLFNVNDDCNVPRSLQTVSHLDQMEDGSLYAGKKTHNVQKRVLCIDCGKSFTRKSSLIVHQRIHTGEKMFMCSECGKRFGLKSSMVRHMRIHSTKVLFQQQKAHRREKPYKCLPREKSCSRTSQKVANKRNQKVESHPEDSGVLNKENDHLENRNAEEFYKCLECEKCFRRRNALIRHQRIHKGNSHLYNTQNTIFDSTIESGRNCSTSESVYKDDTEIRKQEQPDVTEKSNPGLDANSYIVIKLGNHTGCKTSSEIKSILCIDCGKCFTRKSSLIVHQRIHTGEKLFMCTDCGRRFSLKSSLVRHMRTHSPKILNICSDCGKCFSRYSSLFQHQKVHKKEKSFKCPQYKKSFSWASQLLFHRRAHKVESYSKSETGENKDIQNKPNHCVIDICAEEPHVCLECGKHFTEKHLLIRHQSTHIGNSESLSYMDLEINAKSTIPPEAEGNRKTSPDISLKKSQVSDNVVKRECAIDNSICKSRLPSSRRPYHCIQCGKSFTRKSSLIVHHRTHTGEKRFICTECGKRFGFKSSLVRHLRTHTGQMLNICSECGIYFSRYCDLLLHLENHIGQLQFAGNALSKAEARDEQWQCNTQQSLSEHKGGMTVPSVKEQESGHQKKDQRPNSTGYLLSIASSLNDYLDCEEKIQEGSANIKQETSENLSVGQLQFAGNALSKAEARDEQWQCNTQQSLSAHKDGMTVPSVKEQESGQQKKDQRPNSTGYLVSIASSFNDYFDQYCEEKKQEGSANIKQETSENLSVDGKPLMRQNNEDVCTHPSTLSLGTDLSTESITEGCSEKTDETIDSSEQPIINVLNNHNLEEGIWDGSDHILRRTQLKEKRFLCSECGKNFTRKSSLIVHQRIHTGEKLFICSECGKRFGLKSSVVRHMRTHNAEHFMCMACGKNFRDYSKFLEHQKSHLGELPFPETHLSVHLM